MYPIGGGGTVGDFAGRPNFEGAALLSPGAAGSAGAGYGLTRGLAGSRMMATMRSLPDTSSSSHARKTGRITPSLKATRAVSNFSTHTSSVTGMTPLSSLSSISRSMTHHTGYKIEFTFVTSSNGSEANSWILPGLHHSKNSLRLKSKAHSVAGGCLGPISSICAGRKDHADGICSS